MRSRRAVAPLAWRSIHRKIARQPDDTRLIGGAAPDPLIWAGDPPVRLLAGISASCCPRSRPVLNRSARAMGASALVFELLAAPFSATIVTELH
jgi:hypothetical protein